MRALGLGVAAALAGMALAASPAPAKDWNASQFTAGSPDRAFARGERNWKGDGDWRDDDRGDRRRHRRGDSVLIVDREWQGDTAWRADSYNDWWHERPNRSFPRWVSNNQGCDRIWWGGEGWRC